MVEICQGVQDWFGMPAEWALGIVVPIIKGKGDIRNYSRYCAEKLLEHCMKVMERLIEKRLCRIVSVGEIKFCFLTERGTIDALCILRGCKKSIMLMEESCGCVLRT